MHAYIVFIFIKIQTYIYTHTFIIYKTYRNFKEEEVKWKMAVSKTLAWISFWFKFTFISIFITRVKNLGKLGSSRKGIKWLIRILQIQVVRGTVKTCKTSIRCKRKIFILLSICQRRRFAFHFLLRGRQVPSSGPDFKSTDRQDHDAQSHTHTRTRLHIHIRRAPTYRYTLTCVCLCVCVLCVYARVCVRVCSYYVHMYMLEYTCIYANINVCAYLYMWVGVLCVCVCEYVPLWKNHIP